MRIILQQIAFDPLRSLKVELNTGYFVGDGLNDFTSLVLVYVSVSFLHCSDIVKEIAQLILSMVNIIELLESYQFSMFSHSTVKHNYDKVLLLYLSDLFLCALFTMPTILTIPVKMESVYWQHLSLCLH